MKNLQYPSIEQIDDILRNRFGLKPEDHVVNFEIVRRDQDPERYDKLRAAFEKELETRSDQEAIQRRSYFGETFAVHLQSWFAREEVEGIPSELWAHYPICTLNEIGRIQSPSSAEDHLLILRADAIADSARLKRVFMKRREKSPKNWSLTSHFDVTAFERYISALPDDKQLRCRSIPVGMGFLREPNGACIRSPHGDFIIVSETLKAYLYYMNVFLLARDEIPMEDCVAALMIALRTMFLTETPDFDLDPRGQLPVQVDQSMEKLVDEQLQFVIGHEYAHLLLEHLDASIVQQLPLGVIPTDVSNRSIGYYTPRHQQEFAADAGALLHVRLNKEQLAGRLNGATWFFLGLEILYAVSAYVNPMVHAPKTHPDPIDRIWALRKEVFDSSCLDTESVYSDEQIAQAIEWINHEKESLLKHFIPYEVDALESYGSVYLPSFRGPELTDRLDY